MKETKREEKARNQRRGKRWGQGRGGHVGGEREPETGRKREGARQK